MLNEIWQIAAKDLRIERRSRVLINQVLPLALVILVLFGFALDADQASLRSFAPGLFWVTVLLVSLLTVQRSIAIETEAGAIEGLRLSAISPARIFLGKVVAVDVQLVVLAALMFVGIVVLYDARIEDPALLVISGLVATAGISAAGTLYGVLAVGMGVRETLLPILLLPVLTPVLIGATRAFGDALGVTAVNGWAWLVILAVFVVVYVTAGAMSFGTLLDDL